MEHSRGLSAMPSPNESLKDERLGTRIPSGLKQRLRRIRELYGVRESDLVVDAIEAACDYIERTERYARPIRIDQATAEPLHAVAEDPAGYGDALPELLEAAAAELRATNAPRLPEFEPEKVRQRAQALRERAEPPQEGSNIGRA